MARALIVGCGCRGRALAGELAAGGWVVRGTSRHKAGLAEIRAAGHEAAEADPDRPAELLELVGDVTVVHWLLGSAEGSAENLAAIHGPRLERLLEHLVDTPVRGFVYEGAGSVPAEVLRVGAATVEAAAARWHIPVRVLGTHPGEHVAWLTEASGATRGVLGS